MLKTRIRTLLLLIALAVSHPVYAVRPGFYMGFMAGPATNNASDQQAQTQGGLGYPPTITATPKSQQFGSRIFMGYKASEYAGFEMGGTFFSTIRYDTGNVQTCSAANARVRDIDVLGKFSYPVYSFEPYAKAGVAVAYQTTAGAFNPDFSGDCGKSSNITKYVPTYSLGVGYDLTQNWVIDLSANRTNVSGKVGSMTMYALGISYHFVDVYCGQFLCS